MLGGRGKQNVGQINTVQTYACFIYIPPFSSSPPHPPKPPPAPSSLCQLMLLPEGCKSWPGKKLDIVQHTQSCELMCVAFFEGETVFVRVSNLERGSYRRGCNERDCVKVKCMLYNPAFF